MPFVSRDPVLVDPSPTPAPTPVSDKKPDNIIPFVTKDPVISQDKIQSANPDPTSGVIASPAEPLTDTQSQSANPDPTLSKPDTDQSSNEVGLGGMAPEIAPPPTQWSNTPTGQALISKVQNPLGLPTDVAAKLINDAVAPRMPNSNPEVPDYPMGSGKPPPSRALGFTTNEPVQSSKATGFHTNEPVQASIAPTPSPTQNQGPELIGQEDWKKWDEQIKPYDDDPDKIAKSGIPEIKERLKLMLYAQTKKEMRESGFQYDDVQKTIDDVNNAVKTVGGWIAGSKTAVQNVLQIPSQVTGFLGNAIEAGGAANREGSNPLQPPKEKVPSEMGIGIGNIPANTPLTSGDIYTGGTGIQPSKEALQQRSDQAKRALVSGVEEGAASNVEFAENVVSGLIGLTSTAPNAVMRVFGGPQVGYIDPKVQTWLATLPNPVPILSGKGWDSMDAHEMLSNLIAQDVQNNIHSARSSGHLDQNSQELLNTWAGHTVNTPESGARNGFPTPLKAIQDTAGTTNLLMGYPEFGLWGRLAEAAGLNNMVGLMAKKTLQGGAELAEGIAERTDLSGNLKAIRLKDQAIKDIAQTGETAVKGGVEQMAQKVQLPPVLDTLGKQVVDKVLGNSMGLLVSHAAGVPFPVSLVTAPLVSQVLKAPLRVAGAIAKSAGWIPKSIAVLSDETADALRLAADDPENMLATRSPIKQFLAQGINRAAEGAATMAIPAALGSKTPEEFGSLMTMGAGMGLVGHALPDLVKGLQTQLIDRSFITDNNRYRSRTLAPDPMAYGTNPSLDAQTKISMNSADPATGDPLFSNSQRHVLNDLQSHYAPMAEIHVLNPKPYAAEIQRMADLGHIGNDPQLNSYGVAIDPNPGINKARILIRSDHFDDAIHHELSHAITNRMTPDDLRTSFLAYSKTNDPNEFTQNYTQRAKPGSGGVTYDQLPTEEGLAAGKEKYVPGFEGMTKDDMEKEMATEAVSGLLKGGSIRDLTRDPTMLHNMQQTFWRALDDLGLDPVTTRTISPLGLNQSIPAAMVLEPILRDTLKANRGAAEGAASMADKKRLSPLGPVNPDESTIQGLMKKGFDRKQAEDFVAQNKQQSKTGPATVESMKVRQISPAQRARNILRGDHKFSAEDAQKYVPDDAKVASEAVLSALEAKAKDTGPIPPESTIPGVGPEEKPFVPSKDWQEKPDWAIVPSTGGLDLRWNSAGKQEVRWFNPPLQEEVTDKRTGKAQKNAAGEVVPQSESTPKPPEPPETPGATSQKPRKPEPPIGAGPPLSAGPPISPATPAPVSQTPPVTSVAPETTQAPEKSKEIAPPTPEEHPLETTPENVENIQALQKEEGLKPGPAQRVVTGKGKKLPKKPFKSKAALPPFEGARQRAIDELDPKDRSDWETWNRQSKIRQGEPSDKFKRGNSVNDRVMARAAQIQDEVAKGQSSKGPISPNFGEIPNQSGRIGYYGYVGDSGWDDASGMGIGGFPFSNHKGFLIPRYSAAMKKSEGARRGLLPGQEFSMNGIRMRWDDVVPASSPVGPGYVDLYDPSQPPDKGVSPEKIAYQRKIAEGRPGNTGEMGPMSPGESIVGQSLGGKPGPPQPPAPKAPEVPKEESKVETPMGITSGEVSTADQQAQESVKQGNKSDEAYQSAINSKVIESIGPKHAESLNPEDERVKFDPDSGWMTGKYFDPNDAFHQWLLRNQSPEILGTLQKIEAAIADKKDLFVDYASAPQKEKGLATAEQREEAQEASPPSDRDKGLAMIQQAGKNVLPSYVGVSKAGDVIYGGVSPDKVASNAAQITHRLGPQSPYKPGPLGDKVAETDLRGYLWNQQNGWKGDGSAKLKTAEGGTKIPEESEGFVPYEMPAAKGDFWNLAVAGKGTRLGRARMKEGQATSSGRAAELALLNEGMATKEGIVNPLHQKIESETPGWTDKHLHSGYELLRASLTKGIHPSGELPSEPIHPGHEEMAKAMTEKGLPRSCYSSDTEILSRKGWVLFKDLKQDEEVATRNPGTKQFEWQIPSRYINETYSGQMVHFHADSLDVLVTPEHRTLIGRRRPYRENVCSALDVMKSFSREMFIPAFSIWEGVPVPQKIFTITPIVKTGNTSGTKGISWRKDSGKWRVYTWVNGKMVSHGSYWEIKDAQREIKKLEKQHSKNIRECNKCINRETAVTGDDFCALMGAYLSEGSLHTDYKSGKGKKRGIQIAQLPESKGFKPYKELFERIQGFSGWNGRNAFTIRRKALSEYFMQFGLCHEKFIPEEIMNATPDQIRIFLHYYLLGDGCFREDGGITSVSVSKRLSDQLQELWQKVGLSASVRVKINSPYRIRYDLSVNRSKKRYFTASINPYCGTVHCVDVSNGIVYVRRNGKPAWSGNSQVKAGFMPGEEEPSTNQPVKEEPVQPILTTSDRLKKNEHLRSQLEKQQAKLDTSNPEEDKQWDTLAQRIHDLENEHASLSSGSSKANWMPGDVIEHPETGEKEIVKSAALRIGDRIFTGAAHVFAHMNAEEELGRHVKKGEAEEGFMTKPTTQYPEGRFIDRTAAWKLAQANKQIAAGSKPLEEMALYKNQKTMTGGKMEGLRSEDLMSPQYSRADKAHFMPGPESIPTTFKETKKGDKVPVQIPYDIVTSPLIKDHQPSEITKDSPDTLSKDQYKYLTSTARKVLSAYDKSSATSTFANKIVREAKKAMQNPEIAAGEGWYSRMRDLLSQALGKDHELFSHLLGVTSPMENPTDNFLYALEAYDKYKKGDYDRHIDLYRKAVDLKKTGDLVNYVKDLTGKDVSTNPAAMKAYMEHHDLIPKWDSGKLYGFHSNGVLQALARTWLEESKAPKTKNYAGNLFGTSTQATIDTWMARMMRRLGYEGSKEPWRIMPQSKKAPSDLDFAFSQRAFDLASDKLSKNLGRRMNADDLQAILWFFEKDLWEKKGWMKGTGAEKSSLDVPFHTAYPQGPKGPRLPHAEVRAKLRPGSEPEPAYAGAEEE